MLLPIVVAAVVGIVIAAAAVAATRVIIITLIVVASATVDEICMTFSATAPSCSPTGGQRGNATDSPFANTIMMATIMTMTPDNGQLCLARNVASPVLQANWSNRYSVSS